MEKALSGRRIVLGISGGIAAYKSAELTRLLVKAGAQVRVVMTDAATKFITPLTLQALSQHPVSTNTFDLQMEATIGHIELADTAELLVIAPATADVLARLAQGMANDLLTTVALACTAPLVLAPAMNVNMWNHPATQENLATLGKRGAQVVGPGAGELACGWVGSGRMSEPAEIVEACVRALGHGRDWAGQRVLVTAGPTWEAIDPVRFLANRSTGKMGFAIARAAARRGAEVVLVAGPTALPTPPGVDRVDVESAREMREAVLARVDGQSLVVMTAAVADYRPKTVAKKKLKKEKLGAAPSIDLEANPDILAELPGRTYRFRPPIIVGFAAETDDVEKRAVDKRRKKGCDLLVANDVTEPGSGFGTDTNRVLLVAADGAVERLPLLDKDAVADQILDRARALIPSGEALKLA
ncbi:MAG TPA: bifunctional phosphopantothenoylcysteine decarboxylase/phosphopantothenate--cysteine ligase CoaBC [Kofleriaceae bacterium]|nr:bifunctional phosphopantothenoylcysteine decarboxylase/phosphopantothenate--cysteine ligase CoaBC [Kofleriaceae bacterium]